MIKYFAIFIIPLLFSCENKNKTTAKTFYDINNIPMGDSIFINKILSKIVFKNKSVYIDSITFDWYSYPKNRLKSTNSYLNGKQVFENVVYYTNGKIKEYSFIDQIDKHYFYKRYYDMNGNLLRTDGEVFFKGFVSNIDPNTLEVELYKPVQISIFYPNPPDCISKLFVRVDENNLYDVFSQNNYISFLQTTTAGNKRLGNFVVDVVLSFQDNSLDSVMAYNRPLYYKVVN